MGADSDSPLGSPNESPLPVLTTCISLNAILIMVTLTPTIVHLFEGLYEPLISVLVEPFPRPPDSLAEVSVLY